MFTRRQLLCSTALGASALAVPVRRAFADAPASARKFIFVTNMGGWDPTRVFASEFENPNVDMERDAQLGTIGDLKFVDHMTRPSVRTFFENHGSQTAFFNGIMVPSVAHENCTRLIMTGSTRQSAADWGAILAGADGYSYSLPQVVAAGPSYPGGYGTFVTRTGTNGQLPALLDGEILTWTDTPINTPSLDAQLLMDQFVRQRATDAAAKAKVLRDQTLKGAYSTAVDRAGVLKDLMDQLSWNGSSDFSEQITFGVSLLSLGVSRVVTLQNYVGWDSHTNNDATQSGSFEALFMGLNQLREALAAAPGTAGGATLADETMIVVVSEMGRTPRLNGGQGKDHWPYTCAMVCGPGVNGGRVYGGYDLYYYGRRVDAASGDLDDNTGIILSSDVFGATLISMAGVDSQEFLPGVGVISAAVKS